VGIWAHWFVAFPAGATGSPPALRLTGWPACRSLSPGAWPAAAGRSALSDQRTTAGAAAAAETSRVEPATAATIRLSRSADVIGDALRCADGFRWLVGRAGLCSPTGKAMAPDAVSVADAVGAASQPEEAAWADRSDRPRRSDRPEETRGF